MKKILIVDDEPQILEILEIRLKASQYDVLKASDGQEAINMATAHKPDLIIMDIMMPNLPGGDAVKLLSQRDDTKNIPVVFLTAVVSNMPEGYENKRINVNGQFYKALVKPFKTEVLLSEVKSIIG